jgi:hypothetical protein
VRISLLLMCGNALAFGDDLVGRHPQGRTTDYRRARAVGADAEGNAVGVAVNVLYGHRVEPEPFVEHLFERCLVALALAMPSMEITSNPVPTKRNPLGAKGAGEAGTIGALPAIALSPLGVKSLEMPATSARIWRALRDARVSPDA